MAIERRYQVFVSSTYQDLLGERQEVMQALLELDCIPSGMELFPAANESQWTLIQRVIDDCDYYLLVSAGRYGSIGPSGLSYTELEYRYALEKGKPIIAFLHKDSTQLPAGRCETTDAGKAKLETFRELVKLKMVKFWTSPADLGSVVSRSLIQLIKSTPAVGWVRGTYIPDEGASQEILRLRNEIAQLQQRAATARRSSPPGTANLAQGDDEFEISYFFRVNLPDYASAQYSSAVSLSWNDIFAVVSPLLIDDASETSLRDVIAGAIRVQRYTDHMTALKDSKPRSLDNFRVSDSDFQTIKVQLRALGLIEKSTKNRGVKDTGTYWTLTEYGDEVMNSLRAIRREVPLPSAEPVPVESAPE
jgi:hypothetical protein